MIDPVAWQVCRILVTVFNAHICLSFISWSKVKLVLCPGLPVQKEILCESNITPTQIYLIDCSYETFIARVILGCVAEYV